MITSFIVLDVTVLSLFFAPAIISDPVKLSVLWFVEWVAPVLSFYANSINWAVEHGRDVAQNMIITIMVDVGCNVLMAFYCVRVFSLSPY